MNGFWHLLCLWAIVHFCNSQISYNKQWEKPEPYNGLKSEIRLKEGRKLKFDFGSAKSPKKEGTVSKWIRLNGQLSSSHALNPPKAPQFIRKGIDGTVADKQETESIVKRRNINDLKSIYERNSGSKSDSISKYEIESPLPETQRSTKELAKGPEPLHIASHYLKLPEETGKYYLHDHFKRESGNPKKRTNQIGSNDEEKVYHSLDTTSFTDESGVSTAAYNDGLRIAPSNYRSRIANIIENIPQTQENPPSSSFDTVRVERSNEVQPQQQHDSPATARNERQAGMCSPLDPLLHSLKHDDTDESCKQTPEGSATNPDCACVYLLAERDEEGCPSKFYTLCYRYSDQSTDRKREAKSFGGKAPKTSYGENTEIHSNGEQKQVVKYNQQSANDHKLKLGGQSKRMEESPSEIDKKANQTVVPLNQEFKSEDGAQSTTTNFQHA